jgi:uncharacterized protein YdhG (YjbR/CyaY superfamily)
VADPRFASVEEYLKAQQEPHRRTLEAIMAVVEKHFPDLERAVAWNVPHYKHGRDYVVGLSCLTRYVAFSPWSEAVMNAHRDSLGALESTKNLIRIPLGWEPDEDLLVTLVQARLAELI